MRETLSGSMIVVAIATAAVVTLVSNTSAQAPALGTAWGEPDLQGIWTDETDTPLQRPAKYANQEFFTDAQRGELDEARATCRPTYASGTATRVAIGRATRLLST
jgi:hypothetical protein